MARARVLSMHIRAPCRKSDRIDGAKMGQSISNAQRVPRRSIPVSESLPMVDHMKRKRFLSLPSTATLSPECVCCIENGNERFKATPGSKDEGYPCPVLEESVESRSCHPVGFVVSIRYTHAQSATKNTHAHTHIHTHTQDLLLAVSVRFLKNYLPKATSRNRCRHP